MAIPPAKLVSTRTAVVSTKRTLAAAGDIHRLRHGTFRNFLRVEVTCIGGGKVSSFRAYSRELYACTDRNLRKLCAAPKKAPKEAEAEEDLADQEEL